MEAAARGASEAGGLTVGILPGDSADDANAYIGVPIPTGMGHARNVVNVLAADAVVGVGGSYGTVSEMALAVKMGKPVFAVSPPFSGEGVVEVDDAEQAVELAFAAVGRR